MNRKQNKDTADIEYFERFQYRMKNRKRKVEKREKKTNKQKKYQSEYKTFTSSQKILSLFPIPWHISCCESSGLVVILIFLSFFFLSLFYCYGCFLFRAAARGGFSLLEFSTVINQSKYIGSSNIYVYLFMCGNE